jgi:tetratricopeptide (TPR) repeat protein
MQEYFTGSLTAILLVPYLAWGVYTLHLKFRRREELSPRLMGITLALVFVFFAVEVELLLSSVNRTPILLMFSLLGLLSSAAALYGHMVAALVAQIMVEMVMPGDRPGIHEPRYGPAEALEELGDYDGALREYYVMARMFPKDPGPMLRIAENLARLEKYADAAQWFERGMARLTEPDKCLPIANRVYELYNRKLENPGKALSTLEGFVARFSEAPQCEALLPRIARLRDQLNPAHPPVTHAPQQP